MYVTKRLSSLRRSPQTLSLPPPEGPFSGVLVIQDTEIDEQEALCCGLSDEVAVKKLPLPSNKMIWISDADSGEYVMMVPVIDQPLSSSRYYVINARFKHTGEALTCSTHSDGMKPSGLFSQTIRDVKPRPFDLTNIYQQVRMVESRPTEKYPLHAESVARDGRAPSCMSKKFWTCSPAYWLVNLTETEGSGLNATLRRRLPDFEFPVGRHRTPEPVVVGRWYVPFMFVKEHGVKPKTQIRTSGMYYKMSLEQSWEKIFEAENVKADMEEVKVDVYVSSETVVVGGRGLVEGGGKVVNGVVWYGNNTTENAGPGVKGVGLSMGLVERMKWEQARGGWVDRGGKAVRVEGVEEHGGQRGWKWFGCYALVERFVLRRMGGSLVLSCQFCHTDQIRKKWE